MRPRYLSLILLIWLFVRQGGVAADEPERPFVDEPEAPIHFEEGEAWKESAIVIPPPPRDSDLIWFAVDDPRHRYRYAIDSRSLTLDEDGVVRYLLLIESQQGVRNLSYEGMNCATHEYKVYAYAGGKGALRPRRNPQWKPIRKEAGLRVHRDLRRYYMCEPVVDRALDRKRILASLTGRRNNRAIDFLKPW